MAIYINEFDPFAAAWCRELMADGHIPEGDVDERDIRDVQPHELRGYTQWHFFGGVAGWPYALRLVGWPVERRILTGSAPCQPFSAAGKQKSVADERHLWPDMFRICRALRPDIIMGEQVEAAVRLGWLDGVFADLEAEGYACGAAVLGAHSVGAPHIRQRIYWLAERLDDASGARFDGARIGPEGEARDEARLRGLEPRCTDGGLADAERDTGDPRRPTDEPREGDGASSAGPRLQSGRRSDLGGLADTNGGLAGDRGLQPGGEHGQFAEDGRSGGRMGNADLSAHSRQRRLGVSLEPEQETRRPGNATHWARAELIGCADGKARRVEPGIFPLAYGFPNRVGLLRGAGNAIIPALAAEFIRAYLDARAERDDLGLGGLI